MKSDAKTPEEYIAQMEPDRAEMVKALRNVILDNLPKGYVETMRWGMISYEIPLKRYPKTYNGEPLSYAGIANQKNHVSLYLMCVYSHEQTGKWFRKQFEKEGKKLDMGKGCVRFKKMEQIPLDVIGKVIGKFSVEDYIALYEQQRNA